MPALRKSMRAVPRSSTTPYDSPTNTPSEPAVDKKQRSITEWTEPAPQNPQPSFEEHGFARHGVLETMGPLGLPPSAKVKQRARALGGEALGRHSLYGKGVAAFGDEVTSTPEMTPAPELEPDDSERQEEDELPVEFLMHEEEEDDDYRPAKKQKKTKGAKTPVRGKTPVQNKTHMHGKTPVKNGVNKASSAPASPAVQPPSSLASDQVATQRIHTAVNDAILRANNDGRRGVGIALKDMFEQTQRNFELANALVAVLHRNQTPEQWVIFRDFIKASKKRSRNEAKREKTVNGRTGRKSENGHPASSLSRQTSPRTSSEVVPEDSGSTPDATDLNDNNSSSRFANDEILVEDSRQTSLSLIEGAAHPHPFSTVPAFPATRDANEIAPRMSSKSPRKKQVSNGYPVTEETTEIEDELSIVVVAPASKTSEAAPGSDSELSDVNEEIVQKGPPELVQINEKSATAAITAAKKVKSAAVARAAKKSKSGSGKAFGKHANRQPPPTAEQIAEEERLWELRQEMAGQQPLRQFDSVILPTSGARFDEDILDTESLTDSQYALGPPDPLDQKQRGTRKSQHNAKRLREDPSRWSSPQLDSAAATRPSTPALVPAPKRLKLNNGQAARTKRSPVKNRDGGPIAGVAFNGGGGLRGLGPDDNDPHSPQSESDDLCSACRGAGEFVCCEGCPRVFHLLCCDPPRVDVPDGSFYCHECTVRQGHQDESAADAYPNLRPLFKSLERINPRAFALPHDVQNAFEGVGARIDGSYVEEVKKFPLAKNSGYGYQRPDYTKVLDSDQKPILCVQCGVSSGHRRQMLKCDFCHAHWHLDCLDPPLANPPHISLEATQRDAWRCPRHIEQDLPSGLVLQQDLHEPENDAVMTGDAPSIRVARKVRKPRQPEVVEPTFSRGMRNNGLIEIINDPDDETDGEGNYVFGPDDSRDAKSKIFRVPEKGLILDFIDKVKSGRVMKKQCTKVQDTTERKASMQHLLTRPIQQQQAAIYLARLANKEKDIGLSEGNVDALILSLTSEAPDDVVAAASNAAVPPVLSNEREQLCKLQKLIARRLNASMSA